MSSPDRLYHLALRDFHATAGAQNGIAEGWSLPFSYGDTGAEYAALRGHAAAFDRSQRSRFLVNGTDALDVLKVVFAGYIEEIEEGRSMRTLSLGEDGTIDDLVLISRTGGISYLVSGEPGRRFQTAARLQAAIQSDWDVRIDDRTESTCLVAVAGPAAADMVTQHLADALPSRLQLLHVVVFEFHGFRTLAIRTSDLGEDGFEFMVAPAVAQHILETLSGAGVALAGFEAQQIARVESCIPAYHPDLADLTPAQADLDALLGIPGGDESRILSALLLESDGTAQSGTLVQSAEGAAIGEIRSCVYSPTLSSVIALAVLDSRRAMPGTTVMAGGFPAVVTSKPFYRRR